MHQVETGLAGIIRNKIADSEGGWIPFRDFMEMALYDPKYGYYMKEQEKIGRSGDFYTASSVGALLGECVAHYTIGAAKSMDRGAALQFVEWGGGDGRFARQFLDALKEADASVYRQVMYTSVEASPYHRRLQTEALASHAGRVQFITPESWMAGGTWTQAILFSNELPDAFPVHRLVRRAKGWMELGVRYDGDTCSFKETEQPVRNEELLRYIEAENLPEREGQRFEASLDSLRWYGQAARRLAPGCRVLTIDYGHTREELHAAHRMNGTLLCYRGHQASDTPLEHVGEQDITAHVNFSALMEAGEEAGLETVAYFTQKQFLVEHGILDGLQDHDARDPFSPAARRNRAIRQLLLSDRMSELFKVLIQQKR
ncbi:class I SAM-dependent methyltransferase [Paenibacillus validus]|uniref:SAM-dependent methyltransferase n=1 Tax=Paenibacillus validus TaxID=44253 RepID=A0A7X2ZCY9_9BACL|nr:SAM-dependent methyltransferase [Paenibacillus validus]MUG72576.1 SAM-dependent methyltransferase [Paenibacillus validus]